MNPNLAKLQPYPFEKLRKLFATQTPNPDLAPINLSIGEPKSPTPEFIKHAIQDNLDTCANYPVTKGSEALRETYCNWLSNRFNLPSDSLNPDKQVLPVNGTREALFAIAQTCINPNERAKVIIPNPFYQIYEGATLLAGAKPVFIDFSVKNGEVPTLANIDESTLQETQLVYICTPSNPSGEVLPTNTLKQLIDLAQRYDFIIVSDECYSEIYFDEDHPPQGLLKAAYDHGNTNFDKCIAFYSLSKRSNAPGLRSGFVTGDSNIIQQFLTYRTYHGCAMPVSTQLASIAAWNDEEHVKNNRANYRQSFEYAVHEISQVQETSMPDASFYLWLPTPIDDENFALGLYSRQNVAVLPGQYLTRDVGNNNPGKNRVRIALVAAPDDCKIAAQRITEYIKSLS